MSRTLDLSRLLGSEEISHTRLADRSGVILDIDALQVLSVNETGLILVEALKGGVTDRDELARTLVETFDVDLETATADVDEFIDDLARHLASGRGGGS